MSHTRNRPPLRSVVYRFVEVKELADHGAVADVFGYGAEAVILGNAADVVLARILRRVSLFHAMRFFTYLRSVSVAPQSCRALSDTDKFFSFAMPPSGWRSVAVFLFVSDIIKWF